MIEILNACTRQELELLSMLHFYYKIFLILLVVLIFAFYFFNKSKVRKKPFFSNLTSLISTNAVLIGLLAYTFYYIPYERFFPYLARNGNISPVEIILKSVKNPSLYVEFATFATLGGLYALLSDNRRKYKKEISRDTNSSPVIKKNKQYTLYKLYKRSKNKYQNSNKELRAKDAEIAELKRLMLIHLIPREDSTKTKL